MQLLFANQSFQDCYWQQSVADKYVKSQGVKSKWILRSKADTEHGGGTAGRDAVQQAIDVGLYQARTYKAKDKHGKLVDIEEVCINEGREASMRNTGFESKGRAGGACDENKIKNALADTFDDGDESSLMRRPAASKDMLAILDKATQLPVATDTVKLIISGIRRFF